MRLFCVVSLFPVALMAGIPTFQHDVLPMFEQRCIACHGAKASGGLDLRTLASVMSGGTNGKVVEPGKPDASRLWKTIDSGAMPMGGKSLSLEEKNLDSSNPTTTQKLGNSGLIRNRSSYRRHGSRIAIKSARPLTLSSSPNSRPRR